MCRYMLKGDLKRSVRGLGQITWRLIAAKSRVDYRRSIHIEVSEQPMIVEFMEI